MQRSMQIASLAGALMFPLSTGAVAQNHGPSTGHEATDGGSSLVEDLAELRAKVARLEAALEQTHQGRADPDGEASRHAGMEMERTPRMAGRDMEEMAPADGQGMRQRGAGGGMSDGMATTPSEGSMPMGAGGMGMEGMGMGGMEGVGMMGMMKGMSGGMGGGMSGGMSTNSALPGFPGASHIYHVGATGFFLDHPEHIELTTPQVVSLNKIKEEHLLAQNTMGRQIEEAEQQLWQLTAADSPDVDLIEEKIREIERLRGDLRLGFIRAVGNAANELSAEQRQSLMGMTSMESSLDPQPPADPSHEN